MEDNSFSILKSRLSQSNIPGLDGIRAIAIILVVTDHFHWQSLKMWAESLGRTGVTLFFVLSGFLITWLLLREDQRKGTISLHNFYIRRSLRIFPGFYCFWIVYVGLGLLGHTRIAWGNCVAALIYLNNYYWPLRGGGSGAMLLTWSLAVEEQFYLVWPSLFKRFRASLHGLSIALLIVCAMVLLYRDLLVHVWHVSHIYLYTAFDTRMDSLAIGCLLAVSVRTGKARSFVRCVCRHRSLPAITFGLLATSISFSSLFPNSHYWDVEGFSAESILSAVLIVQMVVLGTSVPWSWINWNGVRFIGTISYSWYLYNAIGPDLVNHLLSHSPSGRTNFPLGILAGLLMAAASYYIVEKPFLKLKAKYEVEGKKSGLPIPRE